MRLRLGVLTVILGLALTAAPPTASAQVAGEEQGVTAVRGKHGYVLRFAKRAASTYRRIAGRRVVLGCATVEPSGGGFLEEGESTTVIRAPRRRNRIRTFTRGRADYCFVRLRRSRELVAAAPITSDGRTYLDERRTVEPLMIAFELGDADATRPPSTAEAVAGGRGHVVALESPDASPPPGKIGYWSDGVRFVSAAVTRAGRRLFFEIERDVVRTNVLSDLNED